MPRIDSRSPAPASVTTTFVPEAANGDVAFPGSLTLTFTDSGSRGTGPVGRVLDSLDAGLGRELDQLQDDLRAADGKVLAWLNRSPGNVERFAADPIGALRASDCGVPGSLLDRLEAIGERFLERFPALPAPPSTAAEARVVATTEELQAAESVNLETQGWDLIAAANQRTLNTLIAQLFRDGEIPDHVRSEVTIIGVQVVVEMELDTPTLDLSSALAAGATLNFPVTGGSVKIGPVETPIPAGSSIAVTTDLKYVDLTIEGQAVRRLSFDFTSPAAVYQVKTQDFPFNEALEIALRDELKSLLPATYYLGDVNLTDVPEELRPTGTAKFATQIAADPGDSALLLLMTTASGTPGATTNFADRPPVIPAGKESSLVVSNRLLIGQVAVDQVAEGLRTAPSNFRLSGTGARTASLRNSVDLGGKYRTTLSGLKIRVADGGGAIELEYETRNRPVVDTKDAFFIQVTGTARLTPELTTTGGEQLITFSRSVSDPKGKLVAEWWAWGIVSAAIIASFGSLFVVYGLIAAIVVPAILANIDFKLPNGQTLVGNVLQSAVGTFRWPVQALYPLTSIALPGDLIVTGTPRLAADAPGVAAPLAFDPRAVSSEEDAGSARASGPLFGEPLPLAAAG